MGRCDVQVSSHCEVATLVNTKGHGMTDYLCAIDQGTTSSRAILFDLQGHLIHQAQLPIVQHYPESGWVEHDPGALLTSVIDCVKAVLDKARVDAGAIKAIGMCNQRETTLVWDQATGQCIYPAIVWQDRRSAKQCAAWNHDKAWVAQVQAKTGLLLDPYFSASKIAWILDHVEGARARAECGALLFGTVDCFLLWHLTKGKVHATDITNASRTLLFHIHDLQWDEDLLAFFGIPRAMLPEVKPNAYPYGFTDKSWFGRAVPITGMAGDQQAAAFGQTCFHAGQVKSTYGTGCFMLANTGDVVVQSKNRLLSTIAFQYADRVHYALEGSIFIAGAAVQWLRDAMGLIADANETHLLASEADGNGGVYLVPAFTGLGAPYWDPNARGALMGLTRHTGIKHIVRAALEAVCYQSKDLLLAMEADGLRVQSLRVDGGMAANAWLLQFLADILDCPVQKPDGIESSALGAAFLAGLGVGLYGDLDEVEALWHASRQWVPQMEASVRDALYAGWLDAVHNVLHHGRH